MYEVFVRAQGKDGDISRFMWQGDLLDRLLAITPDWDTGVTSYGDSEIRDLSTAVATKDDAEAMAIRISQALSGEGVVFGISIREDEGPWEIIVRGR